MQCFAVYPILFNITLIGSKNSVFQINDFYVQSFYEVFSTNIHSYRIL